MLSPKPSKGKMAESYNKMKEITHKYGKLVRFNTFTQFISQPLKPGFNGGKHHLNSLSIDVNENDYVSKDIPGTGSGL